MKRIVNRIAALVVCVSMILGVFPALVFAITEEQRIKDQIETTYSVIRANRGKSYDGWCGRYVYDQLNYLGIYDTNSYDGNKWYPNLVDGAVTSFGYTQVKYQGGSCLQNLLAANSYGVIYNIVVGFPYQYGASYSSPGAGHVVFIHMIKDGYVYFSESYDGALGKEGSVIVITVDSFLSRYTSSYGTPQGAIHFTKEPGASINYTTIPDGTYYLKNKATGTYLTVQNMTDANGQNVHVYSLLEIEAQRACQQMTITSEANGQKIRPELCADRVINAYADNVTSGVNVTIYDNTYHASQRWAFEPVDGGYVIHNSQNPSCVLDTNGDNVLVVTKHGGDSQIWSLEEVGHEHSFDEFIYYQSEHPHRFVYKCSCGETYIDTESSYTVASCIECNTPEMPEFIGLRTQYGAAESITFEWTETGNTTHNNWLLYREGTDGWEQIERVDYAESGLSRTLPAGKYKTAVQAYNSNMWNAAGTDWLYTQSDDYAFTVVESHTHSYGEWVETVTATCISGGTEQRECECGDIESRSTESLGHDWDDEYTIDIQPTKTATGLKSRHCARCDAVTDETVIPKVEHEHIYGEWQTTVEPTCVEIGQKEKLCECGASKQVVIESLGHDYADEWTVVTPPTETSEGYEARKCSRCTFLTDVKKIPALGVGLPFVDIEEGKWYYPSVEFAVDNGLFNGVDSTHFAPDRAMSRAMLVSVLYRMEGSPAVSGNMPFGDVAGERYYYSAVLWASQNGIVNGVSEDSFAPDAVITREQMAAILYRYASHKGYDTSAVANLITYPDAMEISNYAINALSWANAEGLITGTTAGEQVLLNPKGEATRAQVATILMRFKESVA